MRLRAPHLRPHRGFFSVLAGAAVAGIVFTAMSGGALPAPAASADDTADVGATTVTAEAYDPDAANAPFPKLEVSVSQTRGLGAQGISVSWKNAARSTPPSQQTGGENFLQIMQCWGDDPDDPSRPDRTTCQYGASGTFGGGRVSSREWGYEIPAEDKPYTVMGTGVTEPSETAIPFKSSTVRDGANERVDRIVNGKFVDGPRVPVNQNPFFSQYTSNEVSWAGSGSDGTGSAKFEVQTAVQSRGLGCGRPGTSTDGTARGQSCWLVIIPRGTADNGSSSINQSGLFWDSWKHHLAVKLDFRPLGSTCGIGAAERQVVGSELLSAALSSWQPALCANGGDIYNMITSNEADATTAANLASTSAPLALTSRPYAGEGADDLIYAPVGLSSVTIAFAIDRFPSSVTATDEEKGRAGLPFTSMNLTPRLIAKLLTSSYVDSLPTETDRKHLGTNPRNVLFDEDFLAINDPEWRHQSIAGVGVSDMLVTQGRSDVALAMWSYVLADPEARAFLNGEPDPWGTRVNKYSSTNPDLNPNGALQLPTDTFPKSDPTKREAVKGGAGELNVIGWRPYTNDLDTSGYLTLRGDAQISGSWDQLGNPPRYTKEPRSLQGSQAVIGLTDSAASEKYQIVSARLKNPAGEFTGVSTDSMLAAASAMVSPTAQTQTVSFDFGSDSARGATAAYPLTLPIYAAANPYMSDAKARSSYATFIRYASGYGQQPGAGVGQLPVGYAPIPDAWHQQAVVAANVIQGGLVRSSAPAATKAPASSGPLARGTIPAAAGSSSAAGSSAVPGAGTAHSATDPVASGAVAGALAGAQTPADPGVGGLPAVLPASLLAGALAAGVVFLIPRLPRRLS
ncbi:hypothetical protein [Microbacterium sp. Leaf203]|uniref:hypothetical protein n=1 Tax=Microbacterium sp. Leaf203 TaxID=1735677 RepID=UPI0006F73AF6|nr:hypothetical protein [Microbacterium sp. Leaf203]KQM38585.1 hypothetical protein ASE56_15175 [Microbacterium sp. Leaf203]